MATVYRVEHPATLAGPYMDRGGEKTRKMRNDHNYGPASRHPSPYTSWAVHMSTQPCNAKCAFVSMQDLFSWFAGWLPQILKEGFVVSKIEGTKIIIGPDPTGQVLYLDEREDRKSRRFV